ncbi:SGNH/GDSL hydrolase family protein [Rosistilla oblonga]|uniref:SGNH/GDSL hydrolase family protein n=1 Tax=Rosistilla oblonga TaxID=2527990 RepID=UPI003A97490B
MNDPNSVDGAAEQADADVGRPRRRKRLRRLLLVGGCLTLVALAYIELTLRRPIGSGPAGPKVAREAFDEPWSSRQFKLLGIGDSVTAGLGAKSPAHSYFQRMLRNPEDEFSGMQGICLSRVLPNIEAENLAVSGSTSPMHWERVQRLPTHAVETFGIVVMTTGGNDLIHSYGRSPAREGAMYGATLDQAEPWIENFAARLDRMLDRIDESFPGGCEMFLANIYDPTDGVGDAPSIFLPPWPDGLAIHARYNTIIQDAAERRSNVTLVPMYEAFLGHGSHCRQFWRETYDSSDPHYWYFSNIEDPNDRGYDAIRRLFLNAIVARRDALPSGGSTE